MYKNVTSVKSDENDLPQVNNSNLFNIGNEENNDNEISDNYHFKLIIE